MIHMKYQNYHRSRLDENQRQESANYFHVTREEHIMKTPGLTMRLIAVVASLGLFMTACDKAPEAEQHTANHSDLSLTVYKSPTCGCCEKWIEHMEAANFKVIARDLQDIGSIKARYHLKPDEQSCHTAVSSDGNYVFEGHIPADIVRRFLEAPPEGATGLSVPGMPLGSPGMEMGDRRQPYDVLLIRKDGTRSVYAKVTAENS